MFISLNKKILYTISIFLILTFTLFVITFYAVYGSKFVEDQRFASLSALQISELSNNNATLRQELNSIRKQIPQVRISAKAQKILESQVDTQINEISQEYQRLEEFSKNYIKRYSSMKEAVKIIISSLLIIAVLILIFGSLIRRWLLIPINRLSQISDKVSAGDLSSRVPLETSPLFRDELSNQSKTLNQMLQNLNQNFNEIKSNEHYLQSQIDNIPDGIRVIDENYNIVIANKTYYKQTQHPVPNSPEKCYFSSQRINHPCISTTHSCPLREIKKNKLPLFKTIQHFGRENGSHFSINAAPMHIELPGQKPQNYIVEAIRDLSNDIEFSHQQKLSSLGFLGTSVAHEIKNHLGSIRMITEAMLNKKNSKRGTQETEYLKLINRQICECINVPERLLNLSRGYADEKTDFNCAENITETIGLLDYEAKRNGIRIEFSNQAPDARLRGNASDFKMALINLIQNAIKAMKADDNLQITLSQNRKKDIIIEVIDTGCGISAKDLPRIFEPFYTTKKGRNQSGTGLGLPIVKSIVERFSGSIRVKSTLGKGSRFTLRFTPGQNIQQKKTN